MSLIRSTVLITLVLTGSGQEDSKERTNSFLARRHELDRDGLTYMEEVTSRVLEQSPEFVFITRHIGRHDQIKPWQMGYFSGRGFVATDLYDSKSLTATIFRKSKPT